jgi:translation initiation factor 1
MGNSSEAGGFYHDPADRKAEERVTSRDPNSRLVYSTGGEEEASDPDPGPKASGGSKARGGAGGSGIRIRLERRASDRVVTVVVGLPGSVAEVTDLARRLKSACGTGGTVKDGALELQGDHRAAVERALAARGLRSKRAGG